MKIEMNEFLKEVTLRICSSLDIEQALSYTREYIEQYRPVDAMSLAYMDLTRKRMYPVASLEREGIRFLKYKTVPEFPLDEDYIDYIRREQAKVTTVTMLNRHE
jgi:hypothetical protein